MIRRMHFWKKRLLLPLAALPVFQLAGGCDTLLAGFASQLAGSTFNTFVGSIHQVLLQSFPSADVLQILLGANPRPFFPGG